VAEVINLAELKGYRAEIGARRQSVLEQRQQLQIKLDNIGHAVEHVKALMGYCDRVRLRLQTFDAAEKRLAFEALNVRITWTPGQPFAIEGTIPLGEIAPISLYRDFCLSELESCQECAFPRLVVRLERLQRDMPRGGR
jgi:hypothetical protein